MNKSAICSTRFFAGLFQPYPIIHETPHEATTFLWKVKEWNYVPKVGCLGIPFKSQSGCSFQRTILDVWVQFFFATQQVFSSTTTIGCFHLGLWVMKPISVLFSPKFKHLQSYGGTGVAHQSINWVIINMSHVSPIFCVENQLDLLPGSAKEV